MTLKTLLEAFQLINNNIITVRLHNSEDLEMIVFEIPGFECIDDEILEQEVNEIRILTATCIKINLAAVAEEDGESEPLEPTDPIPAS